MILHRTVVEQAIDRDRRGVFLKELVLTGGAVPLAMVRKRVARTAPSASQGPRLAPEAPATRAPLLLIHGFGQNRYAFHLPSRSLVNHLAAEGYDVFNVDLRGHGRSRHLSGRRSRGVDDYVREDLPSAVAEVQRLSGARPMFLVGHSLGGLVSYAAAPELAGAVAGIVSVGSPYHFTKGSLHLRAIAVLMSALRAVRFRGGDVPFTIRPIGAIMRRFRRVAESPLYPTLRGWHAGALEPEILDEHLRLAFDRAGISEMMNMFEWAAEQRFGGHAADYASQFERLDIPLLVIAGTNDDLAPPESVRPAFANSRSRDKTYRVFPLGHIDLLVGRDAPKSTWTLLTEWLDARAPTSSAYPFEDARSPLPGGAPSV